eukprot:402651-Amphidinium_carterae.1
MWERYWKASKPPPTPASQNKALAILYVSRGDITGSFDYMPRRSNGRQCPMMPGSKQRRKSKLRSRDGLISRSTAALFLRCYNHYTANHCTGGTSSSKSQLRILRTMMGIAASDSVLQDNLDTETKLLYTGCHALSACKGAAIWIK